MTRFYMNTGRGDGVDLHDEIPGAAREPYFVHTHGWNDMTMTVSEHTYDVSAYPSEERKLRLLSGVVRGTSDTDELSWANHILHDYITALVAQRLREGWRIVSLGGTSAHLANFKD